MLHLVWPALCKYGLSPWKREGMNGCLFLFLSFVHVNHPDVLNEPESEAPRVGHLYDKDVEAREHSAQDILSQERCSGPRSPEKLHWQQRLEPRGPWGCVRQPCPPGQLAAEGLSQGWIYPQGTHGKSGDILLAAAGRMLLESKQTEAKGAVKHLMTRDSCPVQRATRHKMSSRTKRKPWSTACPSPTGRKSRERRSHKVIWLLRKQSVVLSLL